MPTLTTTPAYPVPNKPCKVRATATAGGSLIRLWCTDAPLGSALRKKLDDSGATRVAFDPPTVQAGKDFDFTPDKGGGYVITADELVFDKPDGINPNFGGAYEGDVRGAKFERIQTSEDRALRIAEPLTFDVGFGQDTATVTIHAWDQFIVRTTKDVHGIATPAITATKSARAAAVAATAGIVAAVQDLAAVQLDNEGNPGPPLAAFVIGSLTGSIGNVIKNLAREYDRHLAREVSHASIDAPNILTEDYSLSAVESVTGQAEALSKLLDGIGRHIRNADPRAETNPGSTNSANPAYHEEVGWAALPMANVKPGNTAASIWPATAELWRVFVAHFADEDAHEEADGVNVPNDPSRLLDLHIKFMTELAATTPTTGPSVNSAAVSFLAAGAKKP